MRLSAPFTVAIAAAFVHLVEAPVDAAQSWTEVKCARYTEGARRVMRRQASTGVSREFLDRHEAFLASNCSARADICPATQEEIALADTLTILAVNGGTAGTFLPFSCRR